MQFGNALARTGALIVLLAVCATTKAQDAGSGSSVPSPDHPVYFVLLHSPGPAWAKGVPFREQPGVKAHVEYMAGLLRQNVLVMGGPFLDNTGGLMIARSGSLEEAQRLADEGPAVKSGLLRVEVHPWMVPMATVQ